MRIINIIIPAAIIYFAACNAPKEKNDSFQNTFELAQEAGDHDAMIYSLTNWLANDTAAPNWVLDSLSFYHYFYKNTPGVVRDPKTALFYANKGLNENSSSTFLRDIRAKLMLEQGEDTAAVAEFTSLWSETQDPTYFWDLTMIEILRGNLKGADSMITQAQNNEEIKNKLVDLEDLQGQIKQSVRAEVAFIYLRGQHFMAQRDLMKAAEQLQKALELDPNFVLAQRAILEIQRYSSQMMR